MTVIVFNLCSFRLRYFACAVFGFSGFEFFIGSVGDCGFLLYDTFYDGFSHRQFAFKEFVGDLALPDEPFCFVSVF